MKELSIEEKAKAYDIALDKLKMLFATGDNCTREEAEYIFPELAESEESDDERIKKAIKYGLDYVFTNNTTIYETTKEQCLFWLEKQGNLMKALQISNAKIGELIEKNYYLKEQLEKQGKNNMGISEATKQKLEDNLNKALEKETPESFNKFLDEQKPAWSEEDKAMRKTTILYLENTKDSCAAACVPYIVKCINWLKSLRHQNRWKPSDEQIMALRWVLNHIPYDSHKEEISGLLEQLMKLR